jgi:type I restriction enzyme M protein
MHNDSFVTLINSLNTDFSYYRGVSNVDYKLIPSIGRKYGSNPQNMLVIESVLFKEFKRRAHAFLNEKPKNDWEWLFLAQHHGVPTRLLDWTSNPLIALYFIVEFDKDKDGCLFEIKHEPYFEEFDAIQPFQMTSDCLVLPPLLHPRYVNQAGLFSIQSNPDLEFKSTSLVKTIIKSGDKFRLSLWLKKFNITQSFLFPGLDGLAMDLKRDFNL